MAAPVIVISPVFLMSNIVLVSQARGGLPGGGGLLVPCDSGGLYGLLVASLLCLLEPGGVLLARADHVVGHAAHLLVAVDPERVSLGLLAVVPATPSPQAVTDYT